MLQKKEHILLVDDEQDILDILSYNLEKAGYQVSTALDGENALKLLKENEFELAVLDLMLPGIDGIELCQQIKENPNFNNMKVVFLSARSEDYTQVAGLQAGADDYMVKPISPRLFLAKIEALLRKTEVIEVKSFQQQENVLEIDRYRYKIRLNSTDYFLPKKEFELLALLASKPEKVFSRENILTSVWGNETHIGDRTIDVHIRKLRQKIGDSYIRTVKGIGYSFNY